MTAQPTVLLLGATGRTGQRVMDQLLRRGIRVRALVRSARRLPTGAAGEPLLTVVEADVVSMSDDELLRQIRGCDAVLSCIGHVPSLQGIFGPPQDLVTRITKRLCGGIESSQPPNPVKYILLSSVSVRHPARIEKSHGVFEQAFVWMIRTMIPPAKDNQQAADFLWSRIGEGNPFVQWVAVRPDALMAGEVSEYTLHENPVSSLSAPGNTNMANVAQFMCELVANQTMWDDWKGKLPVIINAGNPMN